MSASSAFVDLLEQLDMWWPEGDGNALRAAADGWSETAELIDEITTVLDAVAHRLTDNYRGEAANRFGETWNRWTNETGHLRVTAEDCRKLAAALTDFASDVDIADRTLVQFIEQALAAAATKPNPLNPMMLPQEWLAWLQTSGAQLLAHLSTQTCAHTNVMDNEVGNCSLPPAPGDRPDIANIIGTNITWPDPGQPRDLSGLVSAEIDFGAGQGFDPSSWSINDVLRLLPWWSRLPRSGPPTVVGGASVPPGLPVPPAPPGISGLPGSTVPGTTPGTAPVPTGSIVPGTAPGTTPAPPVTSSTTPPVVSQVVVGAPTQAATQAAPQTPTQTPTQAAPQTAPSLPGGATPTLAESTVPIGASPLPQSGQPVPNIVVATGPNGESQLVRAQTTAGAGQTAPLSDAAFDKLVDDLLGTDNDPKAGVKVADKSGLPKPPAASKFMPGAGIGKTGAMSVRPLSLSSIPDSVPKVPDDLSNVSFGTPATVAVPAAGAAAVVASKASKRSGSNFPMMPLGGGAMSGGDDSNEPKRRSRKRIVTPPPIVQ
jgi:uncharacterized protein YukE